MNTDPMSCSEAREKLPLYVGSDLDSDVLEAVRDHLERCEECTRLAAIGSRVRMELVEAFRSDPGARATASLWPGVRAVLRAEGRIRDGAAPLALPKPPSKLHVIRRRSWSLALVPVAAAALLFLVAELSGGFRGKGTKALPNPGPASGPQIVQTEVSQPAVGNEGQTSSGLKRIEPDKVRPIRAFHFPTANGLPSGDASLAGYGGVK